MDLTNRSFLKLLDYTPDEIEGLLASAAAQTIRPGRRTLHRLQWVH